MQCPGERRRLARYAVREGDDGDGDGRGVTSREVRGSRGEAPEASEDGNSEHVKMNERKKQNWR